MLSVVEAPNAPVRASRSSGWQPATARLACGANGAMERLPGLRPLIVGALIVGATERGAVRRRAAGKLLPNSGKALDALRSWRQKQPAVEQLPAPTPGPQLRRGNRWRLSEKNVPSCVATWHGWMKSMDSKSFFETVSKRPDLLPQYLDAAKDEGMAGPGNEVCLRTADFIHQHLRFSKSSSVVDLGCGDAALAAELQMRGWSKVKNVDAAPLAPGVDVQNLGSLPADWSDRYHVAILCRALWSLDYLQVLQEAHRILEKDPDARLVVVEPFRRWWGRHQDNEEPENQLLKALERAGFHLLLQESENYVMPEGGDGKAATKGLFQFLLACPVEPEAN